MLIESQDSTSQPKGITPNEHPNSASKSKPENGLTIITNENIAVPNQVDSEEKRYENHNQIPIQNQTQNENEDFEASENEHKRVYNNNYMDPQNEEEPEPIQKKSQIEDEEDFLQTNQTERDMKRERESEMEMEKAEREKVELKSRPEFEGYARDLGWKLGEMLGDVSKKEPEAAKQANLENEKYLEEMRNSERYQEEDEEQEYEANHQEDSEDDLEDDLGLIAEPEAVDVSVLSSHLEEFDYSEEPDDPMDYQHHEHMEDRGD